MSRRQQARRAVLCLLAVSVCGLPQGSSAQDAADDELAELRRAIAEGQARVAAYEQQEEGLFGAIEAVEKAARAVADQVRRADQALAAAEREAADVAAAERALAAQVARTRETLGRRAVALYKAGGAGPVRLIFAPGTLRERLARIQAIQRLFDQDRKLLERHGEEERALAAKRTEALEAIRRRDAARAALAAREAELRAERAAKGKLLRRVRGDRSRERAALNELEAAARALEQTLTTLDNTPVAVAVPVATPFASMRGKLDAPVAGTVLRGFGRIIDEEYRTETFRKGIDFEVTPGEPVHAVADGSVRFAGWFSGYGRMMILDHGDGWFTVSGHLDEFERAVGDAVRAGDPIGTAGETGSLTGPRLYFEIRRGADAKDPAKWLRRLR